MYGAPVPVSIRPPRKELATPFGHGPVFVPMLSGKGVILIRFSFEHSVQYALTKYVRVSRLSYLFSVQAGNVAKPSAMLVRVHDKLD